MAFDSHEALNTSMRARGRRVRHVEAPDPWGDYNNSVDRTNESQKTFYRVCQVLLAFGAFFVFTNSNIAGEGGFNHYSEWQNPMLEFQSWTEERPAGAEVFEYSLIGFLGILGGHALLRTLFTGSLLARAKLH